LKGKQRERERERERDFGREKQRWVKWLVGFAYEFIDGRREGPEQAGKLGLQWRKPERETVKGKQK
jgi:hypothetical protein